MVSPFAQSKSKDTAEGGPSQVTGDSLKVDFGKKAGLVELVKIPIFRPFLDKRLEWFQVE